MNTSFDVIDLRNCDLATAIDMGIDIAQRTGPAHIQWGAVRFMVMPDYTPAAAWEAYLTSARLARIAGEVG